jgi:hypothetical protein
MARATQDRKSRVAATINLPGPHELSEIARMLGLKGAVSRAFQEHIGRIARDLAAAIKIDQAAPALKANAELTAARKFSICAPCIIIGSG